MPRNTSSAKPNLPNQYEEININNQAYLECPKELQAKIIAERKAFNKQNGISDEIKKKKGMFEFETELRWTNSILITVLHILAVYYGLTFPYFTHWKTSLWSVFLGHVGGVGVTGGVHRYWTHRSYKANIPTRIFFMLCYCSTGQNRIYQWVRDHRVHHKFSETDADPHNSNRGFFFAHVGWLMMKKHPEVLRKGREVDMSDVLADPVVAFAEKYFIPLKILMTFVLPVVISVYFWNESWYYAIKAQWFIRYVILLNSAWSVNSVAHLWGNKPYDKNISPTQNKFVSIMTLGEGWHNYHHVFPWDYKTAELGNCTHNPTTAVIDFFALIGWVTDRKQPSPELVKAIAKNRGDGSCPID